MGPLIGHCRSKILIFYEEESQFYYFLCLAWLLGIVFCILPHVAYVLKLLLLGIVITKAELEHQVLVSRVLFKNLQCIFLMRFQNSYLIC